MNSVSQLLKSAQDAINKKQPNEAERLLNEALRIEPLNADVLHNLGIIAYTAGRINDAIEHFGSAAEKKENDPQILYNYATALLEIGRYSDALKILSKVLNLKPDHIPALNKSCSIVGTMGNVKLAEKIGKSIIEKNPSFVEAYNNLGNTYKDQGKIEEAIKYYRKALEIRPDFTTAGSNLLLCLNYSRNRNPQTVFEEHLEWEKRVLASESLKISIPQLSIRDKPQIHIGYISSDFRIHSAGYFIEPIIANHNKNQFKIFCYSDVSYPDSTTERIKKHSSKWRSIYNKEDKDVIKFIQEDEIDILVDLAGHSGNNRLTLFLAKPAPVQITYLGYPNTTGLSTMDYRLTDEWADPEGYDTFYTEKLYRLSGGFLCYRPPEDVPGVTEAPALKNGYITFGSFNNLPKINSDTIAVWSEILHAVPASKLVIKTKPFNDTEVMACYKDSFKKYGIEDERLLFHGHSPSTEEHLNWYNRIDIALDTFPYNGTTTSCEALLMGVPVVSLTGSKHAGRVGSSILSMVGLTAMIASDSQHYVKIASNLAVELHYLEELRKGLRDTLLKSSLCDGPGFTRTLEKAYKEMYNNFRKV